MTKSYEAIEKDVPEIVPELMDLRRRLRHCDGGGTYRAACTCLYLKMGLWHYRSCAFEVDFLLSRTTDANTSYLGAFS
jgi:hypothetical protein